MSSAIERLQKFALESAGRGEEAIVTLTYNPHLYERWQIQASFLPPDAKLFGVSVEEVAEEALRTLKVS